MTTHALLANSGEKWNSTGYFLLRRLHSFLGVFPLGIFLAEHLFTNSFSMRGANAFNEKVDFLRGMPLLVLIEMALIWVPLTFHVLLGIAIARQAQHNPLRLGYLRNWLYTFQRYTGWVVLGFIAFHAGTLRFAHDPDTLDYFHLLNAMFTQSGWMLAIYIVGGLTTIYHFCNGLCTFCMTWGITVSRTSQTVVGWAATAIGLGLAGMLFYSILGFMGIHVGL